MAAACHVTVAWRVRLCFTRHSRLVRQPNSCPPAIYSYFLLAAPQPSIVVNCRCLLLLSPPAACRTKQNNHLILPSCLLPEINPPTTSSPTPCDVLNLPLPAILLSIISPDSARQDVRPPTWRRLPPASSHEDVHRYQDLMRECHHSVQGCR